MKRFIPYGRQYIDDEDISEVSKVLKSDFVTQGPKIGEFEEKIADYCGSNYAVAFNSGTSALHCAYSTLGIVRGDEVITTPNTFVATSNAALYLDARPVFVDIKENGNIDEEKVEEKITDKTKLIVPVHYSGNPANLKELYKLSKKYEIKIIEDAAHALGAKYKGEKIGNCRYSEMTTFSFHPVKHLTTGEGGAVLTNDEEYYEKLRMFRSHGITKTDLINESDGAWYYEMQTLGYNYRITDIQTALGLSQLKKLDKFVKRRKKIAHKYDKAFKDNKYFEFIKEEHNVNSSYHLYPIILKNDYKDRKKEIFNSLREEGLGVQVHYIPVYLQPYYQKLGYKKGLCPMAENFYHREISIPMYPAMHNDDVNYVVQKIFKVFNGLK